MCGRGRDEMPGDRRHAEGSRFAGHCRILVRSMKGITHLFSRGGAFVLWKPRGPRSLLVCEITVCRWGVAWRIRIEDAHRGRSRRAEKLGVSTAERMSPVNRSPGGKGAAKRPAGRRPCARSSSRGRNRRTEESRRPTSMSRTTGRRRVLAVRLGGVGNGHAGQSLQGPERIRATRLQTRAGAGRDAIDIAARGLFEPVAVATGPTRSCAGIVKSISHETINRAPRERNRQAQA